MDGVRARLEKYIDVLMIDEVQDFAGHDFNFLRQIAPCNLKMYFVGDFFQHTFDTSRDGNINKNLHRDYESYKQTFYDMGFMPDEETLSHSYRCSPTICSYITEHLKIDIQSHRQEETEIILLSDEDEIESAVRDKGTIKLFYQDSRKYPLYAKNWGESKGEDHHQDVCVILNGTTFKRMEKGVLHDTPPQTKNKLYVAITRTRNRLFLIPEKRIKQMKT